MAGDWMRPEETARVMTPDGFLKTGDMGVMDERGAELPKSTLRSEVLLIDAVHESDTAYSLDFCASIHSLDDVFLREMTITL